MAQAISRRPLTAEPRIRARGQVMWNLSWTKWHWDRVFSEFFDFPLSISFHRCSAQSCIIGGMKKCRKVAAVQRHSVTPSIWTATQISRLPFTWQRPHHILLTVLQNWLKSLANIRSDRMVNYMLLQHTLVNHPSRMMGKLKAVNTHNHKYYPTSLKTPQEYYHGNGYNKIHFH
jgi:hypothetical protein